MFRAKGEDVSGPLCLRHTWVHYVQDMYECDVCEATYGTMPGYEHA